MQNMAHCRYQTTSVYVTDIDLDNNINKKKT